MKKTVWAAGLFAALIAMGGWCKPFDQSNATAFRDLLEDTSDILETREKYILTDVRPDMDLVRRGIFECIYADNETTSRDRVFIRGSDNCGFLEGGESIEEKTKRLAGYVNAFLPGVHQPEKTSCYAVQFPADYQYRKIPLQHYIDQIDLIPLSETEAPQKPETFTEITAEDTIRNQLHGEVYYGHTEHSDQACELILIAQKQPVASNASSGRIRGGLQSMVSSLGMIVWTGAGWAWSGFKAVTPVALGAYLSSWITTGTWWDTTTGHMLYGDFAPNVTRNAGGLAGVWHYSLARHPHAGTDFTVGDGVMAALAGFGTVYYGISRQIGVAAGAIYMLTLGRLVLKFRKPVKID